MKLSTIAAYALSLSLSNAACNPLTSTCEPVKALGASFRDDFESEPEYFTVNHPDQISYSDDGAKLEIAKQFDNPSIKSDFYIMFGKVEMKMKAAKGTGIVSSFYLQSDDLDEIDFEFLGGDPLQVQSNFFSKGNIATYDRGQYHPTSSDITTNWHTYTIETTKDAVTWAIDGKVVRTLTPDNPQGFPQSPMYVMAGAWAGGDSSNKPGVIEWAGGPTDYSQGPFDMQIKSIIVSDYSSGSQYEYTDQSGEWESIEAVDGEVNGREEKAQEEFKKLQNNEEVDSPSLSVASSASASSSSTSSSSSASSSSSKSASSSSASSSASVTTSSSSATVVSSSTTSAPKTATASSSSASENLHESEHVHDVSTTSVTPSPTTKASSGASQAPENHTLTTRTSSSVHSETSSVSVSSLHNAGSRLSSSILLLLSFVSLL